ncbi:CPBP family intramembrane glutamic endopeptidase [Actinoplanes couchii]|uniref:CAAX amino protease n=1 Tax=Actinoplanes couchii TaxID=403638 RepID=A0ABQ3XGH4_9ACTN|nr:CPBP family intramembrane glutamic endopeptidase [Actinoplanes couchii]MDR6321086.1 membrane protease YdiL (CAAX protease family) [Actinoplanes couchii]GID57598.1 CAAX amino protease [Actinoplanes couchii]
MTSIRPFLLLPLFLILDIAMVSLIGAMSGSAILSLAAGFLGAVATILLYGWASRRLEGRNPDDVPKKGRWGALARGTLGGIGLFTTTVLLIAIFGGFGIDGWGSFGGMLSVFGLMMAVATVEEVLFRGLLFRMVEDRRGTWFAMAVSAAVFGLLHLVNDPTAIGGALAIIAAGLMVAAAYVATRALWVPIGLHLGWNFAEGGLFGVEVSGSGDGAPGLLNGVFDGPAILTGGAFGPEASIFAVLVNLAAFWWFLRLARRRGNLRTRPAAEPTTIG